jgi:Protein of unknown function (DUF2637)
MDDMPEPRHAAESRLTAGQRALSAVAAVLMLGLAALAFRGMFSAVRDEQVPFFGRLAWIVPIGIDCGIVILILVGILLEWLAMPMPALRIVAGFFMGLTMWLNAIAAHGAVPGVLGHLALPVLFIASVEAIRHAVRRRTGLAAGTVREGVPFARWALAPVPTFLLWRRMVLWQETSYLRALEREQKRRRAIAVLRARHGGAWKAEADHGVVWQLVHGIDVEGAANLVPAARETVPGPVLKPRPAARRESGSGPALKLAASKSRSMTPGELEPHVAAMLGEYGTVSQARVKRDLHVSTEKAAEALRLAKRNRTVVQIGAR